MNTDSNDEENKPLRTKKQRKPQIKKRFGEPYVTNKDIALRMQEKSAGVYERYECHDMLKILRAVLEDILIQGGHARIEGVGDIFTKWTNPRSLENYTKVPMKPTRTVRVIPSTELKRLVKGFGKGKEPSGKDSPDEEASKEA